MIDTKTNTAFFFGRSAGLYDKYVPQTKSWISQQLNQSIR